MSDLPTYSVEPLMRAHSQLNSLRKRIRSEITSLSLSRKRKFVHPQKPFKADYNKWFVKPQFKLKKRQPPINKADLIREPQFFYKILNKAVVQRPGPFSKEEAKVVWKKRERLDPQYDRQSQQLKIAAYQRLGRVPECLD